MDFLAWMDIPVLLEEFFINAQQDLIRIAAAIILGMLVGFEREIRNKPAGLRTIILICLGACMFSMVSEKMGAPNADPTRIAAQIVSGIGFLGAGAILRDQKAVYGLTTAAAIWMVASVGMACGFGKFSIAVAGTVSIIIVLMFFQFFVSHIDRAREIQKYRITTQRDDVRLKEFDTVFREAHLSILYRNVYREGENIVFTFRARGHTNMHLALREKLVHMDRFQLRK